MGWGTNGVSLRRGFYLRLLISLISRKVIIPINAHSTIRVLIAKEFRPLISVIKVQPLLVMPVGEGLLPLPTVRVE